MTRIERGQCKRRDWQGRYRIEERGVRDQGERARKKTMDVRGDQGEGGRKSSEKVETEE